MAQVPIPSNTPEQYKPGWQGSTDKKMAGQMQDTVPGLQHTMVDTPLDDVLANGEKYKGLGKVCTHSKVVLDKSWAKIRVYFFRFPSPH
jgi:hypothetical protein